ncbi:MAG: NAD-dependent epimerase/dehydratase family protein, partial [Bacteroidales bacterium]|nr:NAD-dependent epimerase/dehydratase family protein [Bacteroidales bacterium]
YVTVGFPYNLKVWQKSWPDFMRNVIDACTEHKAKLVFFDNIYMYDPDHLGNLTEETPIKPVSRKGKVRAEIAGMLMDAVKEGKLTALIARSADFYGPGIKFSSMLNETVFKPFKNGKKANWLGPVNYKHSFTYTPDAGIATAMLGNTEDAYGQVWHLPTHENPLTGKEWIENIAKEMGVKPAYMTVPKFMVRILGIFTPIMGEIYEMLYQYDRDYVFRSDKFGKRFSFKPTEYLTGIKEVVKADHPEKL